MSVLFGISLLCLLVATRLAGPLRIVPLLIAAPILLAIIGTLLMQEFGHSVPGALFSAFLILTALFGLPILATRIVDARARAIAREKQRRMAELQNPY